MGPHERARMCKALLSVKSARQFCGVHAALAEDILGHAMSFG